MPHQPIVALEVWDCPAADWPAELTSAYGDCLQDPYAWAENCVKRFGAELLYLRLQGTHPDFGAKSASEAAAFVAALLGKVQVPLIITGCGDPAIDNAVLPEVSEAAKGEKCLLGSAVQDNYKTLVGAALRDGHAVIAESPIDVNIAKQLNILISDMGLALDRIVMDPTIGALGYGLEYAYSIMERARLAALSGDKTLALPFICFVGQETWKTKEAVVPESSVPSWGNACERGILWETATATALLQSGADILVMRHPLAAKQMKKYIQDLCL
jgi:acetyl-CoA decarbonylase/synthase complex subunit delta